MGQFIACSFKNLIIIPILSVFGIQRVVVISFW